FFFHTEDGIRDDLVTGVQTCALPIFPHPTQPLHQKTVGARPHPSFLTSTRRLGASASTYTSPRLGLPNLAPLAPVGQCQIGSTQIGRASCRERVATESVARALIWRQP